VERSLGTVAVTDAPPRNPLPLRQQLTAIRMFDSGPAALRDAGGHVTRLHLGPRWLVPPVVVATSPRAARDILSRSPEEMERNRVHAEMRDLLGPNLFDLQYRGWLPRRRALQPVFTKHNVLKFSGHMAEIAEAVTDRWSDGARIDLDTEARRVTLGALGRSVLGLDLQSHTDAVADPVRTAITYIADRGANPFRVPRWLPVVALAMAVLAVMSASDLQQVVNDETIIATADDLNAMQWIDANLPKDAVILTNASGWMWQIDRGSDARARFEELEVQRGRASFHARLHNPGVLKSRLRMSSSGNILCIG
jgi:hypothetical protein